MNTPSILRCCVQATSRAANALPLSGPASTATRHRVRRKQPGSRLFSTTKTCNADFTHAVIGAGVVGLAVARRLQMVEGANVVLIEKHGMVGSETSARNSEVIHAGLYYGPDSLKTKMCIQGKEMMYDICGKNDLPHSNCGKWLVAQTDEQMAELEKLHKLAQSLGVPTRFLSREEAQRREPDVRADAGVLESSSTGIVDSHALMQWLQGQFEDAGGDTALASEVTKIRAPSDSEPDWEIWTGDEDFSISVENVINSAGLYACEINNMILPPDRHRKALYAKGNYFSYSKSHPKPKTLVYPAPVPGHGGLGTHLTLDMGGRVRFGPDVEWVESPTDLAATNNPERFKAAVEEIRSYLPEIDTEALAMDYAGIRPKLAKTGALAGGKGFQDFIIQKEEGVKGFVNLLGIESPGLTSSLAIAEEVHRLLYK